GHRLSEPLPPGHPELAPASPDPSPSFARPAGGHHLGPRVRGHPDRPRQLLAASAHSAPVPDRRGAGSGPAPTAPPVAGPRGDRPAPLPGPVPAAVLRHRPWAPARPGVAARADPGTLHDPLRGGRVPRDADPASAHGRGDLVRRARAYSLHHRP